MPTDSYEDYNHLPPATLKRVLSMGGKVAKLL